MGHFLAQLGDCFLQLLALLDSGVKFSLQISQLCLLAADASLVLFCKPSDELSDGFVPLLYVALDFLDSLLEVEELCLFLEEKLEKRGIAASQRLVLVAVDIDGLHFVESPLALRQLVLESVVFLDKRGIHLVVVGHLLQKTLSFPQNNAQLDNARHLLRQQSVILLRINRRQLVEPHRSDLLPQLLDLKLLVETLLLGVLEKRLHFGKALL